MAGGSRVRCTEPWPLLEAETGKGEGIVVGKNYTTVCFRQGVDVKQYKICVPMYEDVWQELACLSAQ